MWSEYKNQSGGPIRFVATKIKNLQAEETRLTAELKEVQASLLKLVAAIKEG